MAEFADQLVGLAQLIAEANGTERIPHIKEKINEMVIYATMTRAGLEAAIANAELSEGAGASPASYTPTRPNALRRRRLQLDGPPPARHRWWVDPHRAVDPGLAERRGRPFIEKYMATKEGISGEYRLRLFHAIRDFTADAYGGWQLVTMLQSGGGLYARSGWSRANTLRHGPRQKLALRLAGL